MKKFHFSVPKNRYSVMIDAPLLSPTEFREKYPEYSKEREKDCIILGDIKNCEVSLETVFPKKINDIAFCSGSNTINIIDIETAKPIRHFYFDPETLNKGAVTYTFTYHKKEYSFSIKFYTEQQSKIRKIWNQIMNLFSAY